ncbi:hypothetical protein ACHAW6_007272 [Cyclotella cf. meneghiniana]
MSSSTCSAFLVPRVVVQIRTRSRHCRSLQRHARPPTTALHARFVSSFPPANDNDNDNDEKHFDKRPQKLLLHPTAPLHPLLNTPHDDISHPSHLHHYTLPPLRIGTDDYRPTLPKGQRIVAIGDVHGDLSALHRFLLAARVINPSSAPNDPLWTGGTAILLQTGDVLDRGAQELGCFRVLCSLARQAREAGGRVHVLYGNHESLNAAGLFQYADPGGNAEFESAFGERLDRNFGGNRWRLQFGGNEPARWAALEPGGLLAGGDDDEKNREGERILKEGMMKNMMVACLLGRTVFVHGGLRAEHLINDDDNGSEDDNRSYSGISKMNARAREWITRQHHGANNNHGDYQTVEQVIASAQHRARVASKSMPDCLGGGIGASSPVWMRDYSQPNDAEPQNRNARRMLDEALKAVGKDVQRMVMGHTPQNRINSALGGRAWRIDVGASAGVMGGTPEVLEIIHEGGEGGEDLVSVLTVDGRRIDGKERAVVDNVLF